MSRSRTSAVSANQGAGTGSRGDAAGDSYLSIKNLARSASNDTLYGDGNLPNGGAGNSSVLMAHCGANHIRSVADGAFYNPTGADSTFCSDATFITRIAWLTVP